jgi:hypothetical protein
MRGTSISAVLAALCLFWAAAVSIAILHLGTRQKPKSDLTLCPLCDQHVLIPREKWNLHPDTP